MDIGRPEATTRYLWQTVLVVDPPSDPIAYLRRLLREQDDQTRSMIGDRDRVHAEYGRLFHPDNLDRLTAEDFKGFLRYDNNRHWWGIHRHETKLVSDMGRLRRVLTNLLDESQPIVKRLDRIDPKTGPKPLPGLGKAVITPICMSFTRIGTGSGIASPRMP